MDRLGSMAQFVRVVDAGSFSAAARALGQGQPAISKAVAQLEARLGTPLLVRTTRAIALTDAGRAFYAHAVAALDAVEEAEAAVRETATALAGPLKVCAPVTFARLHIVPRLKGFMAAHPGIDLELVMDDRRIDLIGEGIDLAVRAGPLDDSSLVATRLGQARRQVVVAPQWIARHGVLDDPGDLIDADPVIYRRNRDWIFARAGTTLLVTLRRGLQVSAAEGQRAAVLSGLGPTIASHWVFADAIADGRAVVLLDDWTLPEVQLWLVTPAGRHVNARARAFMAFLKAIVASAGPA